MYGRKKSQKVGVVRACERERCLVVNFIGIGIGIDETLSSASFHILFSMTTI